MSAGPREPRETVAAAIWAELRRQAEEDTFGPCVVESDGIVDGSVDMGAVAAAVVEALGLTEEWRVEMELSGHRVHCGPTPFPPRGVLADDDVVERRWVSGWSVVGGEPT